MHWVVRHLEILLPVWLSKTNNNKTHTNCITWKGGNYLNTLVLRQNMRWYKNFHQTAWNIVNYWICLTDVLTVKIRSFLTRNYNKKNNHFFAKLNHLSKRKPACEIYLGSRQLPRLLPWQIVYYLYLPQQYLCRGYHFQANYVYLLNCFRVNY